LRPDLGETDVPDDRDIVGPAEDLRALRVPDQDDVATLDRVRHVAVSPEEHPLRHELDDQDRQTVDRTSDAWR
jgi:hypothetical protein